MTFPDITPDLNAAIPALRGRLLATQPLAPRARFRAGRPAQAPAAPGAWESPQKPVDQHAAEDLAAAGTAEGESPSTSYSSEPAVADAGAGTLASDEALAALREKLTGN